MKKEESNNISHKRDDIAVIGVGFDIAGAQNLDDYWKIYENNIDCIRDLPEFRKEDIKDFAELYSQLLGKSSDNISYNKAGYLDRIDEFDHEFFKISPLEAQVMDPVQRILLQTVYKAFNDAGYTEEKLKGTNTGLYIGYTPGSMKDNYSTNIFYNNPELIKYSNVGNMPCILPSRASYALNLHGPTVVIDSACSSSLVAIHDACESIKNGTCSMAIAGGIRLHSFPIALEDMNVGFETDDNKTRTFDNTASGAAIGEGSAVVLLKSLSEAIKDRDNIYGVIKGSAVNNDGTSASLTAPNPKAQTQVLMNAYKAAEINPEDIDYIETHGTATALGDPIEYKGLTTAFEKSTEKKQFCALSSSKSNIGHLYEVAGVASFIKAIAALQNKKIPGSNNFNTPNLKIDFVDSPFYVSTQTKDWIKDGVRTCGVSAFGISGTNCHVVLQEYTHQEPEEPKYNGSNIIGLSAKSLESLTALAEKYKIYLNQNDIDLHMFASNVNLYRTHYSKRVGISFSNKEDLLEKLHFLSQTDQCQWNDLKGIYYFNEDTKPPRINYSLLRNSLKRLNKNWISIIKGKSDAKAEEEIKEDIDFLGEYYSFNAKVDWEILYKEIEPHRFSFPPYQFKRTRCWLPKKELKRSINISKEDLDNQQQMTKLLDYNPEYYYKRTFVKANLIDRNVNLEKCLLIHRKGHQSNELFQKLEKRFHTIQELEIDTSKALENGLEKYFKQLYSEVDFQEFSHVVINNLEDREENRTSQELLNYQKTQLLSLICLYKEQLSYDDNILRITPLISNSFKVTGEERLNPNGATIFGVAKSLNRMSNNMTLTCIDMDNETNWDTIVDEICSLTNKDIIAYRRDIRYFEQLQEVTIEPTSNKPVIKDNGLYLISGGLGGIGFETAKEMTKRARNVSLILLGRSSLPKESEWNKTIESNPNSELAEKVKRLQLLKSEANYVEYHAVSIDKKEELSALIKDVNSRYGRIDGVVHAAGVSGGIAFNELNEEYIEKMMLPKVVGTQALDQSTRDQKLDFFLMFSSISTIFSSADLPGYVAGNMYLDSYSDYRSSICDGKSITVNWATWTETGMAKRDSFTVDTLFKTIQTKEAISALFNALLNKSGSVVIGKLNFEDKIAMLMKTYPILLSEKILEILDQGLGKDTSSNLHSQAIGQQYEKIEQELIKVCCKNLGYEEININHNFFELGANSILLSIILEDLNELYPGLLQVTDLFSYPTVSMLAEFISSKIPQQLNAEDLENKSEPLVSSDNPDDESGVESSQVAATESRSAEPLSIREEKHINNVTQDGVAIIGVGLDIPNAKNLDSYWEMLINGLNAVKDIPENRAEDIKSHLQYNGHLEEQISFRKSGYLEEINKFDHSFFGISPRDASLLDPVLRLFLETCSNAIDDSGYGADGVKGTNTGVFLGYTANLGNAYNKLLNDIDPKLFSAALPIGQVSMTASRTSYVFDLKGPSMVIDTACSSSLVALHMACEQIRFGKCDMALAGGASLMGIPLDDGSGIGFESPEKKTRAFSDNSSGAAIGEGVGVVLLKSLKKAQEDGDSIYGVIKGSAVNQDGSSFGIAAPNHVAQTEVIQKAWKDAGVTANDISYIEAHGTGTQLGDPIEVKGIVNAFETMTNDRQICGLGSVKTNIGHANEAAGMCSLFKVILALQNKIIPRTLNFQVPNSNIDFINSPLYVVDKNTPLKAKNEKPIIGISGFGMSGTNAHIVLEEGPKNDTPKFQHKGPLVFTISAKTDRALAKLVDKYKKFLEINDVNLYDLIATLNIGRKHYSRRISFLFKSQNELIERLREIISYDSFEEIDKDWFNFGRYSIVPEVKKEKYPHEITRKEQIKLTQSASNYSSSNNMFNTDNLNRIMRLYVSGADINWKDVYSEPFVKLHLPTYPYERIYHWYDIPKREVVDESNFLSSKTKEDSVYDSFFHSKKWVGQTNLNLDVNSKGKVCLLIHRNNKENPLFVKGLRDKGVKVLNVYSTNLTEKYTKIDDQTFYIDHSIESYKELFTDISHIVNKVVHLGAYREEPVVKTSELYEELEYGFFDVVNLTKGMMRARFNKKVELVLVGCNAYTISGNEEMLLPHNATVLSMGKVIEQEYTNISARAIDTDMKTPVSYIIEQLLSNQKMYLVGLREGKGYVEEFGEVKVNPVTNNRIEDGGTYIITGGTSGIGLQNGKLFSTKAKCNLVLLSRKGFPNENEWETHKEIEEYAQRIKDLEDIKRNGSNIEILECDISDEASVSNMLELVREKYKNINGIVHCAGVIEPGFIFRKEKEQYLSVFAPKIMGTWLLDQLTQEDDLDFFLLHSSNVTDAGEPGQSCYMAANAFLDSYTDYLNNKGTSTYTVNWVAWKETGMAFNQGTNVDTITKAITTEDALNALYQLINSKPQRLVIGQFNEEVDLLPLIGESRNLFSKAFIKKLEDKNNVAQLNIYEETTSKFSKEKTVVVAKEAELEVELNLEFELFGNVDGRYTNFEKQIGKLYCELLEYQKVDIYEGFFEMGGDSILLTEMHDIIDELYPNIVQVADLFEYDSIHSLAGFLSAQVDNNQSTLDTSKTPIEDLYIQLLGNVDEEYTPVEKQVGKIYCELLEYDEVDIYEGFFEMGGDSILLTEMHDIIEEIYPNIVQVADLFEFDSIHSLAGFITSQINNEETSEILEETVVYSPSTVNSLESSNFGLSCAQERIYYDYRFNKNKLVYNIGFVTNETDSNYEDLVANANKFLSNFEMLRTTFEIVDKKLVQVVNPFEPIRIQRVKVDTTDNIDFKKYLKTFKLNEYPLYNLTLFESPDEKLMLFDVHHILLDGYSSTILQEHMQAFGEYGDLKPVYPYSKYVKFEEDFFKSSEYQTMGQYWKEHLLGFDFTNPLTTKEGTDSFAYGNQTVNLKPDLAKSLSAFSKDRNTTLYNLFLGAFNIALNAFTGRKDLAVLTPVLNRYKSEFKNSIGVFTNLVPLRVNMESNLTLDEFIKALSKTTVNGIRNQYFQFNHILSDLEKDNPQFFFYMDFEDKSLKKNRVSKDIPHAVDIPKFLFDLEIKNLNDVYNISASYKKSHFTDNEVKYILDLFLKALDVIFTTDNLDNSLDELIQETGTIKS